MYREDYARAGIRMLPVIDHTGDATFRQILAYSAALIPTSLLPAVAGMAGNLPPAGQVEAVIERHKAKRLVGGLLGGRAGRGQLAEADVAEVAFGAFRLEADITLPRVALRAAGNLLAVDGQLDRAVVASDAIVVPLGRRFCPPFAGQAAFAARGMRPVGRHLGPPDAEHVAVARVVVGVAAV